MQPIKILTVFVVATAEVFAEGGTRRIIVSIPDRKIALLADGKIVKVYDVAVGKQTTPSPSGSFQIVTRVPNPAWYQPGQVVAPGPQNPLGTRWMGLGYKGYGIHGTNRPQSIGKAASHGCIRMRNRDVEELFSLVQVGDPVDLVIEADNDLAKALAREAESSVAATGGAQ